MADERRVVTVLFADVTGSTALGEAMDPEDVRALLARFYAIAKDVIAEHGGTLEKFIGDAVMAVFGLPRAHGDDAHRALSAALQLRQRIQDDPKLGMRLPIRIGVNTGEVVATRDASAGDFLITGDAVNVAARLQQGTDPWAIVCGERTARAAAEFSFGVPLTITAKGKAAGISAFTLLGPKKERPVRRVPLVGREPDLLQLEFVARRALDEKRPFLVSLIAPAGIGKSRLVEKFLDRLPALAPHASVAIAQCLPYGQRLTYWPLRGVLFRLVGIPEDAGSDDVREAVRSWSKDCGIDQAERIADLLSATVGAGIAESHDRDTLFAAWRTAIEAASRRRPLVVIFEDLHWSADSLLDLVEFVMQPRGDSPVLMIALARPELLDRRPAWGGGRRNYMSLALEPLRDDAVSVLVEHLLGESVPHIVPKIVARAEGNPFYAWEIVRAITERVPSLKDPASVDRALSALPDTVQATVLARLDLLESDARRVLQLGSVYGRTFRTPGIAALAPEIQQIDRVVERLVDRDLLRPSDADRHTFRHILIREVAYQTLPRSERAKLHAAAGRWLETRSAGREDSLAELIAYHYRESATLLETVDVDGVDKNDIRRIAAAWLTRAGEVAAKGAANLEAARHLRNAIELASADELPELYERLGMVGAGNAAADAFLTALKLGRRAGRLPDQQLRLLGRALAMYMRWQASVLSRPSEDDIDRLRAEGRALLPQVHDERAIALFLIADAFYPFWRQGDVSPAELAEAAAEAQRGLEIAERLDDANLMSAALDALGSCAQARSGWLESRDYARRRVAFADRIELDERLDAHQVVSWASVLLGDLDEAIHAVSEGTATLQPGQSPQWALGIITWQIYALMLRGTWDEALAVAERAYQIWMDLDRVVAGFPIRGFVSALDVATARRDERLVERYREVLEEILSHFAVDTPFGLIRGYARRDFVALHEHAIKNFRIATMRIELVERAMALCTDLGQPPAPELVQPIAEYASTYRLRILEGQAIRALGVARQNVDELSRALEIFTQTKALPYAARVRCERAAITGNRADLDRGLQELDALQDLEHLSRLEAARKNP